MTLTAAQALGTGPTITLRDGSVVPLYYSFRSLALLEQRFGSVVAIQAVMERAAEGAAFGPLLDMLGAGVVGDGGFTPHVRHRQDAAGNRTVEEILYRRSSDGRDLGDLLDVRGTREYVAAMNAAFTTALGTGSGDQGNDSIPMETDSPGPS